MKINAIEFETADEAIQHMYADPHSGVAITLEGKYLVTSEAEAQRLAARGVSFAYLDAVELADGGNRVVTVPVN